MSDYNPELPPILLFGDASIVTNKDRYGINDETGLGPNGSNKYISFDVVINNIGNQELGDSSVRSANSLGLGGVYNGLDVKVGDWVSTIGGAKVFQITEITEKAQTYISCSVEDKGMAIARQRRDRNNSPTQGGRVIVFETNDNNQPIFPNNQLADITTNNAIDAVQSYFQIYEPFQRFTFYPDITGSIDIGDLVTVTGSVLGTPVTPYRITPAEDGDTVIGVVSDIYGGNNVNVRPYNKIITNFSVPEVLVDGIIGSTWYLSGSDGAYTTSSGFGDPKFFQLTNAIGTSVTGSVDGTDFDETVYNLIINNVEVIAQDAGGSVLSLTDITSSINTYVDTTFVTASIDEQGGGGGSAQTLDSAGTGGENGTLNYGFVASVLAGSGGTGSYPSAPGKFAITASGTSFEVHPTTADAVLSGLPYATSTQIATDIAAAATSAGVSGLTATSPDANTVTISLSSGNLEIAEISNDNLGNPLVGLSSGTGLPTGEFAAPALEQYLALERTDGGDILLQGNWINSLSGSGLFGVSGTPPYLLMLENDNDTLSTYYTGSLLDNKTQNINFSGSGVEVTISGSDGVLVDIKNDTLTSFYTGSEVLTEPTNKINFTGSGVEVETSGSDGILVTIDGGGSGGTYTNSDPTPINFPSDDDPNIPSGTTFANKTFPEMMDLMLYPELDPTLTNPSNTFSISPSGLREIGETIATITLSATFSKGSINPQYTSATPFRSGDPNTYVYTGTGTSNNASTSLTDTELVTSYTVLQGSNSWTGAVSYDAGPQPKTSKDNDYDSPLSAGTTSAITRTITGVYPAFATTSAIGTLTKQSLQVMTTYIQVSMVAETGNGDKQTIDIPDAWSTITGLQQFNTLSGTWDSISLSSFTTSATTQTIQGNSVNYTKYAYNGSTIGARQLRFTV